MRTSGGLRAGNFFIVNAELLLVRSSRECMRTAEDKLCWLGLLRAERVD